MYGSPKGVRKRLVCARSLGLRARQMGLHRQRRDTFHSMISTTSIQGSVAKRNSVVHQSWDPHAGLEEQGRPR